MTDQTPTNTLTDTERERLDHIVHVRPFQTDTLRNIALFAAVESILAAREAHTNTALRAAQAQTLRSAADDYERMYQQPGSATGADWLRRRADRLDAAPAPTDNQHNNGSDR